MILGEFVRKAIRLEGQQICIFINMKAKYESLFKCLQVLKVTLQGLCRSAIAFVLAALVLLGGFTPAANAALFAKKGES